MLINKYKFFFFCLSFISLSFSANATLINGDFSNGVNGWTISNFGGGDPANFYSIEDNGSDPYLQISSGLFTDGLLALTFSQDVFISSANALFSADIKVFTPVADVTGAGTSPFLGDAVLFTAESIGFGQLPLGSINEVNRFFDNTVSGSLNLGLISPLSGFFDLNLQADLSAFIGETTTISFSLLADDDFRNSSYGIDNIQLSAIPVSVNSIPIPSTILLFVIGLIILQNQDKHFSILNSQLT